MRERISSAQTFFAKVVFPVVWIGGFSIGTIALFAAERMAGRPTPPGVPWVFLGATLLGSAAIYWYCVRLKRVDIDGDSLFVSNYRREIVVPLTDVDGVTENPWVNMHPVTIHLRRDTEFGRSITFMPKIQWFLFLRSHPVVAELRLAAARAHDLEAT